MTRIFGSVRYGDLGRQESQVLQFISPVSPPLVSTKLTKVCNNSLKWRPRSQLILLVSAYRYFFCFSPRDRDRLFPPVTLRQVRDTPCTKD